VLEPLTEVFLRANGYSIAAALGASVDSIESSGPGSYGGPLVDAMQGAAVLTATIAGLVAVSSLLLLRRDVT
jgi:hypothetical protein